MSILDLRDAMRKLWEDHITWTRLFIVSAVAGAPDLDATTQRLLANQTDIGNAIKPFYGDAAGDRLTALLRDHILGAAKLLTAAKGGDSAGVDAASKEWYANANDISVFLNGANAQNWPLASLQEMMKMHLDLTLNEAVNQLKGNYSDAVADYDKVHDEILGMADALSSGIINQFPDRFTASPPEAESSLRLAMRKLWEDHITWTRLYIVSAVGNLPDLDATTQRLLANQTDIGNAIKPFYGDAAGAQLTALLRDHILGAATLLGAAKAGDSASAGVDSASKAWYANANDISAFLNKANPGNWPLAAVQDIVKMHLDLTLAEAVDQINGNYADGVAGYGKVQDEILDMADALSSGIVAQFPARFGAASSPAAGMIGMPRTGGAQAESGSVLTWVLALLALSLTVMGGLITRLQSAARAAKVTSSPPNEWRR